jgi:hypothetical protein
MSEEKYKWLDATTRLISLTQQGKISWTVAGGHLQPRNTELISKVFISNSTSQTLRLYAGLGAVIRPNSVNPREKRIVLEFIDKNGGTTWQFPDNPALTDLLEVVQYQASGAQNFLAELEALAS